MKDINDRLDEIDRKLELIKKMFDHNCDALESIHSAIAYESGLKDSLIENIKTFKLELLSKFKILIQLLEDKNV